MRDRFSRGLYALAMVGALASAFLPSGAVLRAGPDGTAESHGRLDGMRFVGSFAPEGKGAGRKDTLFFSDGHFWSANCVPCGFAPGVYSTRQLGDTIHFRGEMKSRERGVFAYVGVVRAGRLSATIRWHKDRWYWSIDREFRFDGTVAGARVTERAASVARTAAAEGRTPKPRDVCPL